MNKLMGFYELKDSGLPAVPWKIFDESVTLNDDLLWTIRTAINEGEDLNLPRLVGVTASEAYEKAVSLYRLYKDRGMVVYYPYFIAVKSGTLCIDSSQIVIEAVQKDLWNFVTYNNKDVTIFIRPNGQIIFEGNEKFLEYDEINELHRYAIKVKGLFRDYIVRGKAILLEWSYAFQTDVNKQPIGDKHLVFYEIRSV